MLPGRRSKGLGSGMVVDDKTLEAKEFIYYFQNRSPNLYNIGNHRSPSTLNLT